MKRETFYKWVLVVIALLPIVWLVLRGCHREGNKRYTVGTTTGPNGGAWIRYTFSVDSVRYEGQARGLKYSPIVNGGRYIVEFDYTDPSNCDIRWDLEVPESIEAPTNGWPTTP